MRASLLILSMVGVLAAAALAHADDAARRFDVPAGPLENALSRIAHDADISLLFDRGRIEALQAPAVHLSGSPQKAFAAALAGTNLTVQRLGAGEYVLVAPKAVQPTPDVVTVPEVLVVGSRSQNSDIRRRQDDIEPYQVFTSADIVEAQASSPDDLLRSRLTVNEVDLSPRQLPRPYVGSAQSLVDLRGLGTDQTLILVDGRRMASLPGNLTLEQTDISGIPLAAVERIETYGGTAGGIYGPGATAGVVNIVLRQNFPSLWAESEAGINDRGDGRSSRLSAGISHVSRDDHTQVSLLVSESQDDGLTMGDRSFVQQAMLDRLALMDPTQLFVAQNVNIRSEDGRPLTLIPSLGGQSLGSIIANIPANSGGAGGNEKALLLAGAGRYDDRLSDDGLGSERTLLTPSKTVSFVGDLRQDFGSHVEVFGNLLFARNDGRASVPANGPTMFTIGPGQLGNPFVNTIRVAVPTPGFVASATSPITNARGTIGLIVHLPERWSLEADGGVGYSQLIEQGPLELRNFKAVDVFSPGATLADLVAATSLPTPYWLSEVDWLSDLNLKLAGPVVELPGGPATLTASAEYRDDQIPNLQETPGGTFETAHSQSVRSGLLEGRLPLIAKTSPLWPLRGLEVQLAGRADRTTMRLPIFSGTPSTDAGASIHSNTFSETMGAKVSPLNGLTFRASLATGFLPPQTADLLDSVTDGGGVRDPERPLDRNASYKVLYGGSPRAKPEHAQTASLGVVLEPGVTPGLRMSADFTRIDKTQELSTFNNQNVAYVLAHENLYPDRVVRSPLTAADIAKGYTGGAIRLVDTGSLNSARSAFEALDLGLQYARPFGAGSLRTHANVTWTPTYRRQEDPSSPEVELAGYDGDDGGLIKWRGGAGIAWRRDPFEITADLQYFGSYRVSSTPTPAAIVQLGAGAHIPSQTYVDLGMNYRVVDAGGRTIRFGLMIKDIFDRLPPLYLAELESGFAPGYSTFGDPSGRRAVFSVRAEF